MPDLYSEFLSKNLKLAHPCSVTVVAAATKKHQAHAHIAWGGILRVRIQEPMKSV